MRKFSFIVHDRCDSVTVRLELVSIHPFARSYLDIPLFSPLSHAFLRTEVMKELYNIASYQHGYKTCVNRQERSNWQKHTRMFLHFSSSIEFIMHMKKMYTCFCSGTYIIYLCSFDSFWMSYTLCNHQTGRHALFRTSSMPRLLYSCLRELFFL